jgi:hypothetical protein
METDEEFRLIGILLGLAIYNGVILDVRFPVGGGFKSRLMRAAGAAQEAAGPARIAR